MPHNQAERADILRAASGECLEPAQLSEEDYDAARTAGVLIVTVEEERAVHRFAQAIRSRAFQAGYAAAINFIASGD